MEGREDDATRVTRAELARDVSAEVRKELEARYELLWATLSELKAEVAQIKRHDRRLGLERGEDPAPSHTYVRREQVVGSAFGTDGDVQAAPQLQAQIQFGTDGDSLQAQIHHALQLQSQVQVNNPMSIPNEQPPVVVANGQPVVLLEGDFADQQPVVVTPSSEGGDDESHGEDEVELEASMWYLPLVVFSPSVPGFGASVMCIFLLAINILVQSLFCSIVITSLSQESITRHTVSPAAAISWCV